MSDAALLITLIRHGHAGEAARDADRALTPKGRRVVREVGDVLEAHGIRFDTIVSSPLVRAVQTAEIVAARTGHEEQRQHEVLIDRCIVPEGRPGGVIDFLGEAGLHGHVALVAHEPILSSLAGHFLRAGFRGLHKGEAVCVSLREGAQQPGRLLWWVDPKTGVRHEADEGA